MSELKLSEEYKKLNKLVFSNQLPENIPICWNNSRTCLGKTKIKIPREGSPQYKITISKFFLCSDHEYIETLVHEMIHVLITVKGEYKKDKSIHGPIFKEYMKKINIDFPQYEITVKESRRLNIDHSKINRQNGFYLIIEDKHYFNLFSRNIEDFDRRKIIKSLRSNYNISKGEIYFFKGKYHQLATASVRRNFKTLTGKLQYLHDKREMESLFLEIQKDSLSVSAIEKKSSFIDRILK